MANYEIRVKVPAMGANKGPKPMNYSTWKCPFCQGKGINPYGQTGTERCPACHGHASWEAETVISTLSSCGHCAASGRVNYMGSWAPCPSCKGSGKV
jgi:DnaJ-class molecular chaperone